MADILKRLIYKMEIAFIYIYCSKWAHFDIVNNLFVTRDDTT